MFSDFWFHTCRWQPLAFTFCAASLRREFHLEAFKKKKKEKVHSVLLCNFSFVQLEKGLQHIITKNNSSSAAVLKYETNNLVCPAFYNSVFVKWSCSCRSSLSSSLSSSSS